MTSPSAREGRAGDTLAVVSQTGPTVSFFDAASDEMLGAIDVLAEPHELCFDPTQRLLWCTNTYHTGYYHANAGRRTQLTVIDPDTRRVVDVVDLAPEHAPHGLALDTGRGLLYVSVEGSNQRDGGVVVIDTTTRKMLGRIDTGAPGPHWFVIDPTGEKGYASNKEAPFVSFVDLGSGTLTTVEVPGSEGLAISTDGSELYVAAPYGSFKVGETDPTQQAGIRVIDTRQAQVTAVLKTENVVFPVCLTSTGTLLAGELRMSPDPSCTLGRHEPGLLRAFSTTTRELIASVELKGKFPLTMTASPDGRLGYVAGITSSEVDIVDLETWTVLNTLDIAKRGEAGAHGLAYIPRST